MLWSSTGILLDHVARDRSEIVVVFKKCCRTPRILQISSTIAINYSDFLEGVAIGALTKISVWSMSCHNFCDALLNLLIFCVWFMSLRNCSLWWCASDISISLATACCLCSSCCWTVESEMPETLLSTTLHPFSWKLCASLCVHQDDLASCLCRSCNPHCEFALRTKCRLALSLW